MCMVQLLLLSGCLRLCCMQVCLSIINDGEVDAAWAPSITIKEILRGIQDLLDCPNLKSPANVGACTCTPAAPRCVHPPALQPGGLSSAAAPRLLRPPGRR